MIMILKEVKFKFFLKKNSIYFFLIYFNTLKLFNFIFNFQFLFFYYTGCLKTKKQKEKQTNKTIETTIPIFLQILLLNKTPSPSS